jgi:hypothetical protein
MKVRHAMSDYIRSVTTIPLPPQTSMPILDFEVMQVWQNLHFTEGSHSLFSKYWLDGPVG